MRKFEKVSYDVSGILPTRSDDGSAGYDFYLTQDICIQPGQMLAVKTNIKACMEKDEVLMLFVRSSVGIKRHIVLANGTGVIDSTYYNNEDNEGNIIFALYNYGTEPQSFKAGERFGQGVFQKYLVAENDVVVNKKRSGGVGSSGK